MPAVHRRLEVIRSHPLLRRVRELAAGTSVHLVGGFLRDRLLGLASRDLDIVVDGGRGRAFGENLARALPARFVDLGGKDFAAYRLVGADFTLDLWDRESASLGADLERRDFTVNALALELASGELTDPSGGLGDLDRRLLRAVTPQSFSGDPLRVLRLPRLQLQLPGFAAEPATLELARRAAPRLVEVASERIREELARIFTDREAHRGLAILTVIDVYPGLWLGQPGEPGPAGHAVHELEELAACVRRLREIAGAGSPAIDLPVARLASTLVNLPAEAGNPLAALVRYRDAGFLTRAAASRVSSLLEWEGLPASDLERRHFLHHTAELWPTALAFLGARTAARGDSGSWERAAREVAALAAREGEALLDPPRLLTGDDVGRLLGIEPGPEVGRVLAALRRAQVEGRVRTREEAVAFVEGLGRRTTGGRPPAVGDR